MRLTFVLVCFFVVFVGWTQQLKFDILYGNYHNDHYEKKFHVQERRWVLDNDQLSYSIDAHDTDMLIRSL
ncbi:MAG: hypothetical protein R2799_00235 [Crocinitomicaceae bacterium]